MIYYVYILKSGDSLLGPNLSYNGNRISPLQFAILMKMTKGRMYGYNVLKELRDHFQGVWEPQTGALYPSLKKLQDHGLLVSETSDGEEREYYRLSDAGVLWLRETVSMMGGKAMMGLRFASLVIETQKEMGLPSSPIDDHESCSKDEKRERLMHIKEHLERDLEAIHEMISDLEKENA